MAGPGRAPNLFNLTTGLNGSWQFLGKIVTTGAGAVNNATTATPFNQTPLDPSTPTVNFTNTLAGKTLIIMPVSDALWVLPAAPGESLAQMAANPVTKDTGARPGLKFSVGERPSFVMDQRSGWLQLVSDGGGVATLLVWELY